MAGLKEGEKYLTIQLLGALKVSAFPNPHRKDNKQAPHFKGDGIAVWVNAKKKKESKTLQQVEEEIL